MDPFDPLYAYNASGAAQSMSGSASFPAGFPQHQQQQMFNQGGYGARSPYGSPYGGGHGGGRGGRGRQRGGRRSGGGGGGGFHGGNPELDRQRAEEERARRVREKLFKVGEANDDEDFYPQSDLFTLKKWIEEEAQKGPVQEEIVLKAFRIMVTEQPHKTTLIAALLGFLVISPDSKRSQDHNGSTEWDGSCSNDNESLGVKITKDLVKAFRSHLHSRLWRNVRLSLHFFAALIPLGIVTPSSMRNLLAAFSLVLNEPGVTLDRGDRAAMCIIEVLCRSGRDLIRPDTLPADVSDDATRISETALAESNALVEAVETYAKGRKPGGELKRPWLLAQGEEVENDPLHEEGFEHAVEAVLALRARGYLPPAFLPTATDLLPPAIVTIATALVNETSGLAVEQYRIAMPEVLVPPEEDDFEGTTFSFGADSLKDIKSGAVKSGRGKNKAVTLAKGEEEVKRAGTGPEKSSLFARWFLESTPLVGSPSAVVLRSLLNDVVDLYEVNRKECARILFGIAKWLRKGTFAGKAVSPDTGLFGDADDTAWVAADGNDPQGGWIIDDTLVETILSASFLLPHSPHISLYYHSLLREITTLSPQTLAPAIGRTVRRIYGASRSGRVSSDVLKHFCDWFSVHLSNFNFSWGWKEWIPDMQLPHSHPSKSVARRIVELEVRLAYYDRIKGTLPEEVQAGVLRPEEPSPCFTYENPSHPYHARAATLTTSLRARAAAPVVLAELESLKRDLIATDATVPDEDGIGKVASETEADLVVRDIMTQVVLNIGSRSFSHFLNIVERYHALLRQLSSTPSMRLAILASTTRFWARSAQWITIVFDKLMQYRIVEPADIISFIFEPPPGASLPAAILEESGDQLAWSSSRLLEPVTPGGSPVRDWASFDWYEIVRLTIEKVNGRVEQVRRRLAKLQREEAEAEERREAEAAAADEMEDSSGADDASKAAVPAPPKTPFSFPTSASLPPRPASTFAPEAAAQAKPQGQDEDKKKASNDEKRQSVDEARSALDAILTEQRKVLAGSFRGLVQLYKHTAREAEAGAVDLDPDAGPDAAASAAADEARWRAWWAREYYVAYLRQFNREFVNMKETLSAVSGQGATGEQEEWKRLFEEACRVAWE